MELIILKKDTVVKVDGIPYQLPGNTKVLGYQKENVCKPIKGRIL